MNENIKRTIQKAFHCFSVGNLTYIVLSNMGELIYKNYDLTILETIIMSMAIWAVCIWFTTLALWIDESTE